jgi:hypothetical protein
LVGVKEEARATDENGEITAMSRGIIGDPAWVEVQ